MPNDNIYDIVISELILRSGEISGSVSAPSVSLRNPDGDVREVHAGYIESLTFKSDIDVMPMGYSVVADSHVISTPTSPFTTIGSTSTVTTIPVVVNLPTIGDTYVVSTTVDITNGVDTITMTDTWTITAVGTLYYGVKPFELIPVTTELEETASSSTTFDIVGPTVIGRLNIVLPVTMPTLVSVVDPSGLIITIADDFTVTTSGPNKFYVLNYDTELTGPSTKTFGLNFS